MTRVPSKYPNLVVEDPVSELYTTEGLNDLVEQSAIFAGITFPDSLAPGPGVVLTSQCDIQRGREDNFVLLARILPIEVSLATWLVIEKKYTPDEALGKTKVGRDKRQRKNIIDDFASAYMRNKKFQYYYLHELPDRLPHSLIHFEVTTCMKIQEVETKRKICVLKSPFREAVPSHYSAYIGRIGTAEFDHRYLTKVVEENCHVRKD